MSTGVGCHFLLWRVFLTQGSNPGLPHCRQMLYHLGHQGSGKTTTRTLAYRVRPPRGESPQCCWHSSPCRSTEAGRRELSPRAADNSKRGGQRGATGETRRPWWAGLDCTSRRPSVWRENRNISQTTARHPAGMQGTLSPSNPHAVGGIHLIGGL